MKPSLTKLFVFLGILLITLGTGLNAKDRTEVPEQDTWLLTDIYANDTAWTEAKDKVMARLPEIEAYRGKLGESADTFLKCMILMNQVRKDFSRVYSYANMKSDLDVRDSKAMEMLQSLAPLAAEFGARIAWLSPEILAIPKETLDGFFAEKPSFLKPYRPVIDDMLRMKPYTLSTKEEKIIADAGLLTGTPDSVYSIFSDADIPRATVKLSDGKEVRLDAAAYTYYRAVPNRIDREIVFDAFFSNLNQFRATFGTLLNSEVKKNLFRTRARGYESCLEAALTGPNIPVEVYHNLIRNVHKNLPTLWRYLKLRQRIMGLDELKYSDLYASIVKEVDLKYSVSEAKKLVLNAVTALGPDYQKVMEVGLNNRWIDWHPTTGKRSGAYSNGSIYDVHPYILLNFTGTYDEVSTLAHELGHTMHSYLSNHTQPYPTAGYTTFVAEVASTCNEHLLMNHMLQNTDDDDVRLFLLGSYVDNVRQTLFRQTQFAEFELKIHEMVEAGAALTGDNLNKVYQGIIDAYYGVEEGVTTINPVCYSEWSYIPHFYMNFYVFTYATSITASTALSQNIISGKPDAVKNYRKFLGLGDSLPPVEELKIAGVDMTTDEPFSVTMQSLNRAMDEMEEILDRR